MPFALLHRRRRGIAIDRLPTSGCTIMGEDRVDRPPRANFRFSNRSQVLIEPPFVPRSHRLFEPTNFREIGV